MHAHLAHAAASVTRLVASDANAWAEAVARWSELGDRWVTVVSLVREAEAAAAAGAADQAATSLRRAHTIASELGATPLLAEIDAVSSRTRVSIETPTRIELDVGSAERLDLTPREAEVLALVAAGRTNRQIGDELYVSDKTASRARVEHPAQAGRQQQGRCGSGRPSALVSPEVQRVI